LLIGSVVPAPRPAFALRENRLARLENPFRVNAIIGQFVFRE
jgi:hypothetical protein